MDNLTWAALLAGFAAGYLCGRPVLRRRYPRQSLRLWWIRRNPRSFL